MTYKFTPIEISGLSAMKAVEYLRFKREIKLTDRAINNNHWMVASFTLCLCMMLYCVLGG